MSTGTLSREEAIGKAVAMYIDGEIDSLNALAGYAWDSAVVQKSQPQAEATEREAWLPMEMAPKDGSMLHLLVKFDDNATEDSAEPCPTIGANNFDHDETDEWKFAGWDWSQDCFTQGTGTPVGWLPMIGAAGRASKPIAQQERDAIRDAALEEVRAECQKEFDRVKEIGLSDAMAACTNIQLRVRALKSPAQPAAQSWGASSEITEEYKAEQSAKNKNMRALLDCVAAQPAAQEPSAWGAVVDNGVVFSHASKEAVIGYANGSKNIRIEPLFLSAQPPATSPDKPLSSECGTGKPVSAPECNYTWNCPKCGAGECKDEIQEREEREELWRKQDADALSRPAEDTKAMEYAKDIEYRVSNSYMAGCIKGEEAGFANGVRSAEAMAGDARQEIERLNALINNPQTHEFLESVRAEAAHQRDRWGDPHDRSKSAENWFWLVGYLSGKCLRACITGDKFKALHHTISTAAALANWYEAIQHDESGSGIGADVDIKPHEEGGHGGGNVSAAQSKEGGE